MPKFYYKVPARESKTTDETPYLEPAIDVDCQIMRYYRDYDKSFYVETDEEIKGAEPLSEKDPAVTTRLAWNENNPKDKEQEHHKKV